MATLHALSEVVIDVDQLRSTALARRTLEPSYPG
jgi:hypothetical protein